MGKQIVSALCKALLFRHKWFLDGTGKTEGAWRPLKGREHHSYENETQPNTRCRPSHLSRTIHSSRKGNLGFSRCLHRKGGEIRPRKYHRHQNFNITNLACQIDNFRLLLWKGQLCKFRLSKFCFQHPSSCIRLRSTSFRNPLREDIAGAANLHPHPHGNCGNEPSSRVE